MDPQSDINHAAADTTSTQAFHDPDRLAFISAPLASGNSIEDTNRDRRTVIKAGVVLTDDTGQDIRVDLEFRHGAWWAPDNLKRVIWEQQMLNPAN